MDKYLAVHIRTGATSYRDARAIQETIQRLIPLLVKDPQFDGRVGVEVKIVETIRRNFDNVTHLALGDNV